MNRDKATLLKYLDISENEIRTKFPCIIKISAEEYKFSDNDLLDDEDFQLEAGEESSFKIPGTIEIEYPEQGESINIFLPYPINIIKPDEFESSSKGMVFSYEAGDLILNAYNRTIETNIETLNNLFENRVKYLRGYLPEQLEAIWSQLESTVNYRRQHLMLILSLLYAKMGKDENGKNTGPVLVRHTPEQEYKKEYAIGSKDSSHFFSIGAQSFNYGYTTDAIWASINKNRYGNFNIDDVIPEELDTIYKNTSENTLTWNLARGQEAIKNSKVSNYSDLENLMAGRYDEMAEKKKNFNNLTKS